MNNPSPLVPQGSSVEQKNKGRARVKIAVFFVLAVHGIGLLALLLQGCHKEDTSPPSAQTTNAATPTFEATTPPVVAEPSTPTPAATPTAPAPEATTQAAAPAAASEYTIASHDTYSTIAKKFGVTVTSLKEANPGVEPTKLAVGKKIHIPAPTRTPSTTPGATTPEAATGENAYTVKSGDTLTKIAEEHRTTVRAIRAANNLKTDRIVVGQKLKIPAKGSAQATETASISH